METLSLKCSWYYLHFQLYLWRDDMSTWDALIFIFFINIHFTFLLMDIIWYFQPALLNLDVIFNTCGVFPSFLSHHNFTCILSLYAQSGLLWIGCWIWALGSCRVSIWGSAFIINQNLPKITLSSRNTTLINISHFKKCFSLWPLLMVQGLVKHWQFSEV